MRVAHVEATGVGDTPEIGGGIDLRAEVELPGLTPADVLVEAAFGRVDDADGLHEVTTVPMAAREHRGLAALVHRHRAADPRPAPSATPSGCCRTRSTLADAGGAGLVVNA